MNQKLRLETEVFGMVGVANPVISQKNLYPLAATGIRVGYTTTALSKGSTLGYATPRDMPWRQILCGFHLMDFSILKSPVTSSSVA
jgi:hypothetical protein